MTKYQDGYIVVIFGSTIGDCELSHCPMEAIGPVTWQESIKVAEKYKDWHPHRIMVRTDEVITDE